MFYMINVLNSACKYKEWKLCEDHHQLWMFSSVSLVHFTCRPMSVHLKCPAHHQCVPQKSNFPNVCVWNASYDKCQKVQSCFEVFCLYGFRQCCHLPSCQHTLFWLLSRCRTSFQRCFKCAKFMYEMVSITTNYMTHSICHLSDINTDCPESNQYIYNSHFLIKSPWHIKHTASIV